MNEAHPMIKISVEVEREGSTFTVPVRAKSIEYALNAVKGVYSTNEARVRFPLDPDSFFVADGSAYASVGDAWISEVGL